MANFGSSFAESFESSYKTSSDASLELLKEKIKADQAKAEEKYKATTLRNSNIAIATEFGDQDIAKKIINVSEAVGDSSEGQKNVNEFAKFMLKEKMKTTAGKSPVKGFVIDASSAKATPVINPETGKPEFAPGTRLLQAPMSAQTVAERTRASKEAGAEVELATKPTIAAEVEKAKQEVKLDYPNLDEKGKSAVAAYKFVSPRVEKLNTLIDNGLFKDATLIKQITMNKSGDLVVPNGSPLEEAIGYINDIKLTGFNIAGAAFTGTEKQVAFTLLDPTGKSDERYKRDLASFRDLFGTRVEAGVEGLRGAKKIAEEVKSKREGEPQYEYRTLPNGKVQRRLISGK